LLLPGDLPGKKFLLGTLLVLRGHFPVRIPVELIAGATRYERL
jgi:hypothetical protein